MLIPVNDAKAFRETFLTADEAQAFGLVDQVMQKRPAAVSDSGV